MSLLVKAKNEEEINREIPGKRLSALCGEIRGWGCSGMSPVIETEVEVQGKQYLDRIVDAHSWGAAIALAVASDDTRMEEYAREANANGVLRMSGCRGLTRHADAGVAINLHHETIQESVGAIDEAPRWSKHGTPQDTWTRHGAFSSRQLGTHRAYAEGEEDVTFESERGWYTALEDAAAQAVTTIAAQFHLRMEQLEEASILSVTESNHGNGGGNSVGSYGFVPGFLETSAGSFFKTRRFPTLQLSLLNAVKKENHFMRQQERVLRLLSGENRLVLCLDGEGGYSTPHVEYTRVEGEALGKWRVHLKWRVLDAAATAFKDIKAAPSLKLTVSSSIFNVALGSWGFGRDNLEQEMLNLRGVETLRVQVEAFSDVMGPQDEASLMAQAKLRKISAMIEQRIIGHELLIALDTLIKAVGGATRINCKSAKDRTQLLGSILKSTTIQRLLHGLGAPPDYALAREFMWGSGLQVAHRNTGEARFKLGPQIFAQNLYPGCFFCGFLQGLHNSMNARWIND